MKKKELKAEIKRLDALTAKIEELKDARKEVANLQEELAAERSRNYPTEIEGMKKTVDYFHDRNAKLNRELGGIAALHRGEFYRLADAHHEERSKLHEIIDDLKSQVRALTPEVVEPDDEKQDGEDNS